MLVEAFDEKNAREQAQYEKSKQKSNKGKR